LIIYSVTVNVQNEIADDWRRWMRHVHIPDVMATGCFTAFGFHELLDPTPEDGSRTFNIQYACQDLQTLQFYRQEHSPALQAEHTQRYEGKFVAFRTVLQDA
jgi:hypothetical protein